MYECVICQSVNHSSRLHCQNCGTIPACYSWTGKPINTEKGIEVIAAVGVIRVSQKHTSKVNLRTSTVDYSLGE